MTPPLVTRSPSSTTRSGTTMTPNSASSSSAVWCVFARRPVITPACAHSIVPVHTPAITVALWAASTSSGASSPFWYSAHAPCLDLAFQPPPVTMTISASPGVNRPSVANVSPLAPRTVS